MRMIDQDHSQRKNRLASVLKSLDNKKAALERRIKRNARQQQIHENLDYDLYYIEHQSLLLDIVIVALTAVAVVKGTGAY